MSKPLLPYISWIGNNSKQTLPNATTVLKSESSEITMSENINNFSFEPLSLNVGREAILVISIADYVIPGESIRIEFDNNSFEFVASTTPSTNEFWTEDFPTVNMTYLQHVAYSLADLLQQSIYISNRYNIIIEGSNVTIQAKLFGEKYNILSTSTTSQAIFFINTLGRNKYISSEYIDYRGYAQVFIGNEQYGMIVDKNKSLLVDEYILNTATQKANVNFPAVGNYVEPILPLKITAPQSNYYAMDLGIDNDSNIINQLDSFGKQKRLLLPYFVLYGDSYKYIINGQTKKYTQGVSRIHYVQLGALDKLEPYDLIEYVWIPNSPKRFKFMTSCPNNKYVTYNSHEYIQFIVKYVNDDIYNFNINLRIRFTDGTYTTVTQPITHGNILSGNVSIDVSPLALGLKGIEQSNNKLIDTYDLKITWDLGESQTRSYKFDRNCYKNENENQIIFLNEYGGWESFNFNGEIIESFDKSVQELQRNLPFNANTKFSMNHETTINVKTDISLTYTLRSGLISKEYMKWARKLMESSSIFIYDSKWKTYKNILLVNNNWVYDTQVKSNAIDIMFKYTNSVNTISR